MIAKAEPPTPLVLAVGQRILAARMQARRSRADVARAARVPERLLAALESGQWAEADVVTVEKLGIALGVPLPALLHEPNSHPKGVD